MSLVACALIAYQLYSSRRTRSEASKLKWDQVIFGEEPIIRLEKTKTSKRNNILEFAMGDEELEVIRTIQRDRTIILKVNFIIHLKIKDLIMFFLQQHTMARRERLHILLM